MAGFGERSDVATNAGEQGCGKISGIFEEVSQPATLGRIHRVVGAFFVAGVGLLQAGKKSTSRRANDGGAIWRTSSAFRAGVANASRNWPLLGWRDCQHRIWASGAHCGWQRGARVV